MGWWRDFNALKINNKTTLILAAVSVITAVASLVVSIVTAFIAAQSTDMKNAIKNLESLAEQAHKQTTALQAQNTLALEQFGQQQAQTRSLADQAGASLSIAKNATAQLAVSRNQLAITAVQLKIYRQQARLASLDAAQRFRQVGLQIDPISLPTSLGTKIEPGVTFSNFSTYPAVEKQIILRSAVVVDVSAYAEKAFNEVDRDLKKYVGSRSTLTIGPGQTQHITDPLGTVDDNFIFATQNAGYSVVVISAVVYKDPFGGLHHEYVCRYSRVGHLDQTCASPPSD